MPLSTSRTSPIIVEREAELTALDQLRAEAATGHSRMALIVGEAGVGKSRLTRAVVRRARTAGFDILIGKCSARDREYPFAPFVDALRQRIAEAGADPAEVLGPQAADLAELLPEHRHLRTPDAGTPQVSPEQNKRRLFETIAALLRGLAARQPLLVVLEDLHWCDRTSLELLELLPRRLEAARILCLATCRADEASREVTHSLVTIQREHASHLFTLAPLSESGVAAILTAMLPVPPPAPLVGMLHARTAGNPLLIEELLAVYPGTGPSLQEAIVPATVRDLVAQQMDGLDAATQHVAALAAVAGERVDVEFLLSVSDLERDALMDALRALIDRGILIQDHAHAARGIVFRHALTRDAILERLLLPERQALHRLVADTLEAAAGAGAPHDTAGALGFHFHVAERWDKALAYAMRAGEAAWRVRAATEAVAHFRRALDAAIALDDPREGRLHCRCGEALALLGAFDEAAHHLETTRRLAHDRSDPDVELDALDALAGLHASRDYHAAHHYAEQALTLARAHRDPMREARALNRLGNMRTNLMRFAEGRALHEAALAIVQDRDDRWSVADTLDYIGMSRYLSGDIPGARAAFAEAVEIFADLGDTERAASALTSRGLYLAVLDSACPIDVSPATCRLDAERGLGICRDIGWRAGEAYALVALATCDLGEARYGDASRHAEAALTIAREIDHPQWCVIALFTLGLLHAGLLDDTTALRYLRQACELARTVGSRQWMNRLEAWISRCAARAQPAESIPAREVPCPPVTLGQRRSLLTSIEQALRVGKPQAAESLATRLLDADGPLRHAEPVLLQADALAALGRLDESDTTYLDARHLAGNYGPAPLLWRIAAGRSRLWRDTDASIAREEATEARNRIGAIADAIPDPGQRATFLDAPDVRPWADPTDHQRIRSAAASAGMTRSELTDRELEVLRLLAAGRTNAQMAETLFISRRTVATHIEHIFNKLGVASRAEAAAWAVRNGIA